MSPRSTFATASRIARQLSHDHRTVVMLLFMPTILITLLRFVFNDSERIFDTIGGPMLAVFPFVTMFLVTSITTLRERTGGTLERLLVTPIHKLDLIFGYAITFSLVAIVQVLIATFVSTEWLGLDIAGQWSWLLAVAALDAVLGVALGLFVSAFARTEFQAVQFMPAFVLPQFLLCGLLVPREDMHQWLYEISKLLPLSYAIDAINQVVDFSSVDNGFYQDILIVSGFAFVFLIFGALTLRRKTK